MGARFCDVAAAIQYHLSSFFHVVFCVAQLDSESNRLVCAQVVEDYDRTPWQILAEPTNWS